MGLFSDVHIDSSVIYLYSFLSLALARTFARLTTFTRCTQRNKHKVEWGDGAEMTITGKKIKTAEKNRSLFRLPLAFGPIQQSASHNGGLEGVGAAVSSKGRGRGLFLRRG